MLPPQVFEEATAGGDRPGAHEIREAVSSGMLHVVAPSCPAEIDRLAESVDRGEAAAIALALELGVRGILMNDAAGRRLAEAEGLVPVGTLGTLVRCARAGLVIDAPARLSALEAAGLRMDARLRARVLEELNATPS